MNKNGLFAALCLAGVVGAASAETVTVTATGQVLFNGITAAPLGAVLGGETCTMSFTCDSTNFVDGIPGDLRSYPVSNFSLSFSDGVSVGLMDPFTGTPYFTVIDGFPVSDGFFVSSSAVSPGGVELEQAGYQFNLDLGYVGSTLSSTDITNAYGTYTFDGLTRFGMNIWRIVPDNVVMEMDFVQLTIVPAPGSLLLLAGWGIGHGRRRR